MAKNPNIMDRVANLLGRARDLSTEIQTDMASLHAELRAKRAERDRIAALPVDDASIRERIAADLAWHAAQADQNFAPTAFAVPDGQPRLAPLMSVGGLVLLGFGDQMAERLFELAKDGAEPGITDAERAAKLARIDREIDTLGRTIEKLRRSASQTLGVDLPVSEGADPAIWLAPDSELNGGQDDAR